MPLYLEWAPLGVFSSKPKEKDAEETKMDEQTKVDKVSRMCHRRMIFELHFPFPFPSRWKLAGLNI